MIQRNQRRVDCRRVDHRRDATPTDERAGERAVERRTLDWRDLCAALEADDPDPLPEPGDFWVGDDE